MANSRGTRRRVIVGGVAVVVVAAAGTSAWALTGSSGPTYRFATVTRGTVAQSLSTTGTLTPIREADLDFQVSGTVGRVLVKAGQHITAGTTVARLDRTSLRQTVASAKSTLSQARTSLADDEDSQSASSASTSPTATTSRSSSTGSTNSTHHAPTSTKTGTTTPTKTGGTGTTGTTGTGTASAATIARDQAAVLRAQHLADTDLATAQAGLAAETKACASELAAPVATPTATSTASPTPTPTSTSSPTSGAAACTAATKTLLADQTTVSQDQQAVETAEAALTADLGAGTTSSPAPGGKPTAKIRTSSFITSSAATTAIVLTADDLTTNPSNGSTPSNFSTGNSASGGTVTAATLASDQSTIDSDAAAVATARADLAQGVLRSPITGKVKAVTVSKGDSVSGSSSSTSPAIEIVGSQQSKVTIGLTAAQVRAAKVGMKAQVTPDGSTATVVGTVVSVGLTEDSTTDTYPVAIALSPTATSLVSGADAAVSLGLATATDAITVPTSAVHRSGTSAYVERIKAGKLVHVAVKVGAVGTSVTQIMSGLTVGERIVLADLGAAVPSSSTNLTTRRSGLTGGFGGGTGGFGGGGFTGGPPGGFTGGGQFTRSSSAGGN